MISLQLHKTALYKNMQAVDCFSSGELTADQIDQCFDNGAVWLESNAKPQRLRDTTQRLRRGNKLHLYCNDTTLQACPFTPELVQDFGAFSIWNKPTGMLSQGSKWGDHWALYRWIEQHYWADRQSYITHRLDRYTSGLMVVAHDAGVNRAFHRMFEQRQIAKTYRAIVHGEISRPDVFIIEEAIDGKPARSRVQRIDHNTNLDRTLVEIHPQDGRKHQIRRHLASIRHPVLNDRQYGIAPHDGDLMLQASALAFCSPLDASQINLQLSPDQMLQLAKSTESVPPLSTPDPAHKPGDPQ